MGTVFGMQLEPEYFPLFFVGMWLFVTTLLGLLCGWYSLMLRFPMLGDRGRLLLSQANASGSMGPYVSMNSVLTLEVYERGLCLKMMRAFGPFHRPIFVPWDKLHVVRKNGVFRRTVLLKFGPGGLFERLAISPELADKLWRSGGGQWPEAGEAPAAPMAAELRKKYLLQWLMTTAVASAFFIAAPRVLAHFDPGKIRETDYPPILLMIVFPGTVFGIATLVRYYSAMRAAKKNSPN